MLGAGPRVEIAVGPFGDADERFGLPDLLQDLLDVRLQGLFQRPELLFQGVLQPLPLGECLFGLGAGELAPFDRLGLRGEILFRLGQLGPLGVQLGRGVLELRGRPRDRVHLVVRGWHPAFGGGLPEPPGHGVDLGDRRVQGRPCRRGLVPRAGEQHGVGADDLGRLRDRTGIRQLAPGPPEVLEQRAGPVQLAGQQLLFGDGCLDQLVVFREPDAAAAGPVGRADVLRGRLRPGAGVHAVRELGLRADRRDLQVGGAGDVVGERDRAKHRGDHGRRNAVLLLWDEDVGQRAAAHRSGRDQVAIRLGGGQRRFGQRWIRMDPGGQQPRPVQRTLDGGGLGVIDPVGEPDQPPERGTRAPLPAGGTQVIGGRRVVLLRGDRVAFGAQAGQPRADLPPVRLQVRAGGDGDGLTFGGAAVEHLRDAGGAGLADEVERLGQRLGVGRGHDRTGRRRGGARGSASGAGPAAGPGG